MTYRLLYEETIPDGVRRVAREQIDKAVDDLTDEETDRHEGVHEARKRFKKIRGLLRLVRKEMPDTYKEENVTYRDAGRALSEVRDAEALIEAFDDTVDEFDEPLSEDAFDSIRQALVDRRQHVADEQVNLDEQVEQVLETLETARDRVEAWPLERDSFDALAGGIAKTYGRARDRYHEAFDDPAVENFHEWRKRVKYFWYQTRLVQDSWSRVLKAQRKELKQLSDLLGDDHDLAILRTVLDEEPERYGEVESVQAFVGLMNRRRARLQNLARPLGAKLFFDDAETMVSRLQTYWRAWRGRPDHEGRLDLTPVSVGE